MFQPKPLQHTVASVDRVFAIPFVEMAEVLRSAGCTGDNTLLFAHVSGWVRGSAEGARLMSGVRLDRAGLRGFALERSSPKGPTCGLSEEQQLGAHACAAPSRDSRTTRNTDSVDWRSHALAACRFVRCRCSRRWPR